MQITINNLPQAVASADAHAKYASDLRLFGGDRKVAAKHERHAKRLMAEVLVLTAVDDEFSSMSADELVAALSA